jgi:hypothetical protein
MHACMIHHQQRKHDHIISLLACRIISSSSLLSRLILAFLKRTTATRTIVGKDLSLKKPKNSIDIWNLALFKTENLSRQVVMELW